MIIRLFTVRSRRKRYVGNCTEREHQIARNGWLKHRARGGLPWNRLGLLPDDFRQNSC